MSELINAVKQYRQGRESANKLKLNRIKEIINQGVDINAQDANGNTALIIAAAGGYTNIVDLLVLLGADIYHENNAGQSAYQIAHSWNDQPMIAIMDQVHFRPPYLNNTYDLGGIGYQETRSRWPYEDLKAYDTDSDVDESRYNYYDFDEDRCDDKHLPFY